MRVGLLMLGSAIGVRGGKREREVRWVVLMWTCMLMYAPSFVDLLSEVAIVQGPVL